MKKIFLALAMTAIGFSINAFAEIKIATVDVQQVVQNMPEFSQVASDLKKQFADKEKKLQESRASFRAAAEDFSRNTSVMTPTERQAKQQKLMAQQREIQQAEIDLEKELNQAQSKKYAEMINQVKKVAASVANQQKYDLVMVKAGILYADNQVTDITKQVMDEVKKK